MRMPQDAQQIRELATYYDEADTSQDLERAQRDDSVVAEPMVTTSLRLPRSTINDLRRHAEERGVRPTQLVREWVEAGLAGAEGGEAMIPASRLLKLVREAGASRGYPLSQKAATQKAGKRKAASTKAASTKAAPAARDR